MTYSVNFANYTIGEDAYQNVREVCRHYGKKALLIGGELALKAGKEKLVQALSDLSGTDSDSQAASTSAVTRGKKYAEDSEIEIVDTVLFGTDCMYARMEERRRYDLRHGWRKSSGYSQGNSRESRSSGIYLPDYRGHLRGNYRAFRCV